LTLEDALSLTRQQKAEAQAVFRGEVPGKSPCQWCGGLHVRTLLQSGPAPGAAPAVGVQYEAACPRVKRLEFHPNTNLVSVEFWRRWDESGVVFPEDAYDPDSDDDAEAASG
jgi:hypothetical protein